MVSKLYRPFEWSSRSCAQDRLLDYHPLIQNINEEKTEKKLYEPPHDKTSKTNVSPAKTQISQGILIRVFAVRMKKHWVLSYIMSAQRRLCSGWANAQADLSLRWAHSHFVCFVISRLTYYMSYTNMVSVCRLYAFCDVTNPVKICLNIHWTKITTLQLLHFNIATVWSVLRNFRMWVSEVMYKVSFHMQK